MPEQRSTLEFFLHSSPAPRSEGVHRIRPVVIDTSFLVTDLLNATGSRQQTDFLRAVRHGSLRGFAAHPAAPPILFGLLLAAIATSGSWLPALRDGAPRAWQGVCSLAEQATPRIDELVRQYQSATAAWDDAAFEGVSSSRQQKVGRFLAASPAPMTRGSIADALNPTATERERRETMAELAALLKEVPAFVSVGATHWKLGRRGVDFGGVVDGDERLLSPGIPKLLLESAPAEFTPSRLETPSGRRQ